MESPNLDSIVIELNGTEGKGPDEGHRCLCEVPLPGADPVPSED